ncbi:MAG TPA: MarR family transcriptional regulator [Bacilli bacterium]|nr:MarR family transcriptional regulator [Bacilli bacterium]
MTKLEDCLIFLIGKAQQQAYQTSKALLQPYGITPVQSALLLLLFEVDGQHSSELGERIRLDSATMTGLLDRLMKQGLIERRSSEKDRRINHIYLTDRGKELQTTLEHKIIEINEAILRHFSDEEAEQLKKMLIKIGLKK